MRKARIFHACLNLNKWTEKKRDFIIKSGLLSEKTNWMRVSIPPPPPPSSITPVSVYHAGGKVDMIIICLPALNKRTVNCDWMDAVIGFFNLFHRGSLRFNVFIVTKHWIKLTCSTRKNIQRKWFDQVDPILPIQFCEFFHFLLWKKSNYFQIVLQFIWISSEPPGDTTRQD